MSAYTLHVGDCREVMAGMDAESVDAVVTDPPYGLGFMGRDWDHGVPGEPFWREALRVAKPGAHLLAFGGTRTFHRLAVAIEDAGWELRDNVALPHASGEWGDCPWLLGWVYGSGFPKSHDVSKAIDKAAGTEREVVGKSARHGGGIKGNGTSYEVDPTVPDITAPATPEAQQWQGWGTALKPAWEPIILARKPFKGSVAANVLAHGTGALNVDGCRVETEEELGRNNNTNPYGSSRTWSVSATPPQNNVGAAPQGRWPANLIHDGSEEVMGCFPETGEGRARQGHPGGSTFGGGKMGAEVVGTWYGDTGSAARFFYCAKTSKADRDEGLVEHLSRARHPRKRWQQDMAGTFIARAKNRHPTVKPTSLMAYLVRLVTPPGGVILDHFCGSGSTGKAAIREGFHFIGIDLGAEYVAIARARIEYEANLHHQGELL